MRVSARWFVLFFAILAFSLGGCTLSPLCRT